MHENEGNWTGGAPSLDPPMDKIQEICGSCTPEVEIEFITGVSSEATAHFYSGGGWPKKATTDRRFSSCFFPTAHLHIIYIYQQTMKIWVSHCRNKSRQWLLTKLRVMNSNSTSAVLETRKYSLNKNAFQKDAYRPLIDHRWVRVGECLPRGGTCMGWCLPRGVPAWGVPAQGGYLPGGCLLMRVPGWGCVIWPIPSCIWCYLYAASTPTECQHQCSCLYSVSQVHAGIHPPLWTEWQTGAKILPCPKLRLPAVTSEESQDWLSTSALFFNKNICDSETIKFFIFWIRKFIEFN